MMIPDSLEVVAESRMSMLNIMIFRLSNLYNMFYVVKFLWGVAVLEFDSYPGPNKRLDPRT